ncbi:MAG TPA: PLP-dependent aspartate aminotransferase family protein [Spirochaetota bacterium]|nr:PLP-dependent aspartate aminotransferase family protein [Spirochaetota bacterium]
MKISTILSHAGLCSDEKTGSIATPIYQTATFRHPKLGQSTGFDYSRTSNPTRISFENVMSILESGDSGFAFSSGMAAISAVLMLFSSGDHIVVSDDLYGGTYRVLEEVFKRFGISATFTDTTNTNETLSAIRGNTKAVFLETPSNPIMKISNIRLTKELLGNSNIFLIVDNTFMTPYYQRPLDLGADIVVHSGTKYLSGHNDVLSGVVVTKTKELSEKIGFIQNSTGAILSPNDSFLMLRGLKTLAIRMAKQEENAKKIVDYLSQSDKVSKIFYPGIESNEGYKTHISQSSGFGSMISFKVKDKNLVEKIINNVKVFSFAESLGGVESLVTFPMVQTHAAIPEILRKKLGIAEDLLRLSVGIEDIDDLLADLNYVINL